MSQRTRANFVDDLDASGHILGHRMQLLQIRRHVCMPIKNIYPSGGLNYPANGLSKLGKRLETSGCAKASQNGFEVVQMLYCALYLRIQGAQVAFMGLQLDFNREYTNSQDSVPWRRPRNIILGSDYQIPP